MMPWTVDDVNDHFEGLSRKQKRKWVSIANNTLKSCLKKGGDQKDCEAKAVKMANGVLSKEKHIKQNYFDPEKLGPIIKETWEKVYGDQSQEKGEMAEIDQDLTYFIDEFENIVTYNTVGEVMKTVNGKQRPSSDFLVVEDLEDPSTWSLPVKMNGKVNIELMGVAHAALVTEKGYRGYKYGGDQKGKAISKLKKMYKDENIEWPGIEQLSEMDSSFLAMYNKVQDAFWREFNPNNVYPPNYWFNDVFFNNPEVGTAIIVQSRDDGLLYKIPYEIQGDVIIFGDESTWEVVRPTYVMTGGNISVENMEANMGNQPNIIRVIEFENALTGHVISMQEAKDGQPMTVDVALIVPGWGNKKDNHFYEGPMLETAAPQFVNIKMYATDHRAEEKSVRTWVSTIKTIKGFTGEGAPIGEVFIHKDWFAQDLRNLKEGGLLELMECSILANGTAEKTVFEKDGRKGHKVLSIDEVLSVDWVTRAGAGGHAMNMSESDVQTDDGENKLVVKPIPVSEQAGGGAQPVRINESESLEEKTITEYVDGFQGLPKAVKTKILAGKYANIGELKTAVSAEIAYLKEVIGSGKPFDIVMHNEPMTADNQIKPMSAKEFDEGIDSIVERHGGFPLGKLP